MTYLDSKSLDQIQQIKRLKRSKENSDLFLTSLYQQIYFLIINEYFLSYLLIFQINLNEKLQKINE